MDRKREKRRVGEKERKQNEFHKTDGIFGLNDLESDYSGLEDSSSA